jgi:hypothetical protein
MARVCGGPFLRSFEIIAGLVLAALLFVLLEVIGMVVKFALIAAGLGFIAGLLLARALRRPPQG